MSWTCQNCNEEHSDSFDRCWQCGFDDHGCPPDDTQLDLSHLSEVERNDLQMGSAPVVGIGSNPSSRANASGNERPGHLRKPLRSLPNPFLTRVNAYFGRDKECPLPRDHFRSSMVFWMAPIQLVFTPIKSSAYIRMLLTRIQRRVRRSRRRR